jgi:hypothetical protein
MNEGEWQANPPHGEHARIVALRLLIREHRFEDPVDEL